MSQTSGHVWFYLIGYPKHSNPSSNPSKSNISNLLVNGLDVIRSIIQVIAIVVSRFGSCESWPSEVSEVTQPTAARRAWSLKAGGLAFDQLWDVRKLHKDQQRSIKCDKDWRLIKYDKVWQSVLSFGKCWEYWKRRCFFLMGKFHSHRLPAMT